MAKSQIHWVTPTIILGSFFAGVVLALGHHFFYASLAGSPVADDNYIFYGASVSYQQTVIAIGTLFAFLVKFALVLGVGTSYVQIFWRATKTSRNGQALGDLDTMHTATGNLFALFKANTWRQVPVLFLLALISWCIPIASIITPATLTVESAPLDPPLSKLTEVPNFDFTSLNYVATMPSCGEDLEDNPNASTEYCFSGSSSSVKRVATAVLSQGQILSITPPKANSSWTLSFAGPSLQCDNVPKPEQDAIFLNIWNSYKKSCGPGRGAYTYLAWASSGDNMMPFNDSVLSTASLAYDGVASLYIATMPDLYQSPGFEVFRSPGDTSVCYLANNGYSYTYNTTTNLNETIGKGGDSNSQVYAPKIFFTEANVIRCNLMNATYTASFNYVNGFQNISVSTEASDARPVVPLSSVWGPVGSGAGPYPMFISPEYTTSSNRSGIDPTAVQLLAYQGIAVAFNDYLTGYVNNTVENPSTNTNILSTVLADTVDLEFFQTLNGAVYQTIRPLQDLTQDNGPIPSAEYQGIMKTVTTGGRGSLKDALSEVFQNITISLLTEPSLQPNYSSPWAPSASANVTYNYFLNTFFYTPGTLWIAYGLALFFAAIGMVPGLLALYLNDASYNSDFSTIVRVSRTCELSEEISKEEGYGQAPLPKRLKTARMRPAGDPKPTARASDTTGLKRRDSLHNQPASVALLSLH